MKTLSHVSLICIDNVTDIVAKDDDIDLECMNFLDDSIKLLPIAWHVKGARQDHNNPGVLTLDIMINKFINCMVECFK